MRNHRFKEVEKRAKRRMLVLAIGTVACIGYGAVSLFAGESDAPKQPVAAEAKPASLKTVGIRLVNKNAKPNNSSVTNDVAKPASQSLELHGMPTLPPPQPALSLPSPVANSLPMPLSTSSTIDTSSPLLLPPSLPMASSASADAIALPLPEATQKNESESPSATVALEAPPRMADIQPQRANGRVLVGVPKEGTQSQSSAFNSNAASPKASATIANTESSKPSVAVAKPTEAIEIRVVPPLPLGQPKTMPSVVFADNQTPEPQENSKAPVRISLNESGASEILALPSKSANAVAKNRTPEIVKPKPTKVQHTVTLAQSTDVDEPVSEPKEELDFAPLKSRSPIAIVKNTPTTRSQSKVSLSDSTTGTVTLALPTQSTPAVPAVPARVASATKVLDADSSEAKTNVGSAQSMSLPPLPAPAINGPKISLSDASPSKGVTNMPMLNITGPVSVATRPTSQEPSTAHVSAMPNAVAVRTATPTHNYSQAVANNSVDQALGNQPRGAAKAHAVELECQSATAVDLHTSILGIHVEDESVCRVVHADKTLSIVGNQPGSTVVQVWTHESHDVPLLVRVQVNPQWQRQNIAPSDLGEVRKAIEQAFPKANVTLNRNDDGIIVVRGTTPSEESATRIMEIVRKLCLVPVKDSISVTR